MASVALHPQKRIPWRQADPTGLVLDAGMRLGGAQALDLGEIRVEPECTEILSETAPRRGDTRTTSDIDQDQRVVAERAGRDNRFDEPRGLAHSVHAPTLSGTHRRAARRRRRWSVGGQPDKLEVSHGTQGTSEPPSNPGRVA